MVVKGTFLEIFSLRATLGVKIKIAILWFRTWFRDTTGGFAALRNRFLAAKPAKPGFAVVSHGFAGLGFAREVVSQPKKFGVALDFEFSGRDTTLAAKRGVFAVSQGCETTNSSFLFFSCRTYQIPPRALQDV